MSRGSLYKSAEELRPCIEAKETIMTSPEDTVKQVTATLCYLSGEGRIRKTATAFGISRQVVSKIVRRVHKAIAVHKVIPFTEQKVHTPYSQWRVQVTERVISR